MVGINAAQFSILQMISEAGGEITIHRLDAMKNDGDGYQIAGLNRKRLTEWIRPPGRPAGNAIGIRITDAGRTALSNGERG